MRERVDVPIALDESVRGPREALAAVKAGACDIFVVKLMKTGGILNALKVNAIAEAAGVTVMMGNMGESSLGLAAHFHVERGARQRDALRRRPALASRRLRARHRHAAWAWSVRDGVSTVLLPERPGHRRHDRRGRGRGAARGAPLVRGGAVDPKDVKAAWDEGGASARPRPRAGRSASWRPSCATTSPRSWRRPPPPTRGDLAGADVAVLGIPYEGVKLLDPVTYAPALAAPAPEGSIYYRSGADDGPRAIRRHSVFYSLRHGRGLIPEVGRDLVILDHLRVVDYGDVAVDAGRRGATFLRAHEKLADILAAGAVPIVFGGDHSIPIPVLQVLAGKLTGKLGVVAFDSHFDLSFEPKYWAGSQWARAFELGVVEPANFVQIGIRGVRESLSDKHVADELGTQLLHDGRRRRARASRPSRRRRSRPPAAGHRGRLRLARHRRRRPGLRRARSIRIPPGSAPASCCARLRILSAGRIAGFDICCLAPRYDLQGHLSQLAARAAVEVIAGLALQRP